MLDNIIMSFMMGTLIFLVLFCSIAGWRTKDKVIRILIAGTYSFGIIGVLTCMIVKLLTIE